MNKIKSAKYKGQEMHQSAFVPDVWYVTVKGATLGIPEEVMIDNPLFELQYEETEAPEEKRSCEMNILKFDKEIRNTMSDIDKLLKQARSEVLKEITIPKEIRKFVKIKDGNIIIKIKGVAR